MKYLIEFTQHIEVEAKDEAEAEEKALLVIAEDPSLLSPENMDVSATPY